MSGEYQSVVSRALPTTHAIVHHFDLI